MVLLIVGYQLRVYSGNRKRISEIEKLFAPEGKLAVARQPLHGNVAAAAPARVSSRARRWTCFFSSESTIRAPAACAWLERHSIIVPAPAAADAEVLVGGDIALARELRLGVHLKAAQLFGLSQRPLPSPLPVAASCHDAAGIRLAERLRCDFAVLGTVQATPSHPDATPLGWARFAAMRERSTIPLYAIGGLGPDDIGTARAHGAQGIAAIRALWT